MLVNDNDPIVNLMICSLFYLYSNTVMFAYLGLFGINYLLIDTKNLFVYLTIFVICNVILLFLNYTGRNEGDSRCNQR